VVNPFLSLANKLDYEGDLYFTCMCENIMSEGTVRQWCRMFKDGQTDVHDEEWSDRLAIYSELVQSVDQKICERCHFTISELSYEFPQI
jgi:hypothetical protein